MKKKEMLKEQKKLKMAQREKLIDFSEKDDILKVVYITLGVLIFIAIVFVVINLINGTWSTLKRQNETTALDESIVMCGTMFTRPDKEYLVLAYNVNNSDDVLYASLFDSYEGDLPLYYLDLESGFNKSCLGEKNNLVNDSTKIKFASQVLLHIKDGKIIKSYTTKELIKGYFAK